VNGAHEGLRAWAVEGIGEVTVGTDLAGLVEHAGLEDGDVVVVTSKVVSKSEGRVHPGDREQAVADETVRVVARRGATTIVENRLGMVMAAAGVDASNVEPGHVVLLPEDPDGSARALRTRLLETTGRNVAVVVSDTAGRAWRTGQTELAVGLAGLEPLQDFSGRYDGYGNPLVVTAPAVADEVACVAELVSGKLGGRPVSVVRGLGEKVLPPREHGPGARVLLRPRAEDMFALGAREAVVAAVAGRSPDCFGSPATAEEVVAALAECGLDARAEESAQGIWVRVALPGDVRAQVAGAERVRLVAHAHRWRPHSDTMDPGHVTLSPVAP
jgi:coenzyme F420-0:L-glutamate ligase/coenzyme F420-1:gamma-L-glutamate ligase